MITWKTFIIPVLMCVLFVGASTIAHIRSLDKDIDVPYVGDVMYDHEHKCEEYLYRNGKLVYQNFPPEPIECTNVKMNKREYYEQLDIMLGFE